MAGNLAVLYDPEWQLLRVKMLSVNNNYGGWWSEWGAGYNAALCMDYVYDADVGASSAVEQELRRWRVTNLCNATLLGYGRRLDVSNLCREIVLQLRDEMKFDTRIVRQANEDWDWEQVRVGLMALSQEERRMIRDNLKKRVKTSERRNGAANKFANRKELQIFLELLEGTGVA